MQNDFSSSKFRILHSAFCMILLLVVMIITYSGWQRARSRVLQSEEYRFSSTSVRVTETPPWVPDTIVNDVVSDFITGRSSQDAPIDRELLKELAGAFRAYHWVESVDRVRASFPARVTIDLTYRAPVCMILLPNGTDAYAVDRRGVYLSSDYFTRNPDDVNRYIKVLGVDSTPTGNIGDVWDDPVVQRATALVDHLGPDSGFLGVASIRVETSGTNQYNRKHLFYLRTARNTEIVWGEMPLATNDARKEQLLQLVRQHGSLDNASRETNDRMDLRQWRQNPGPEI